MILGELGVNLPGAVREPIIDHPQVTHLTSVETLSLDELKDGPQITIHTTANMAVHLQNPEEGAALHMIRYDYDPIQDRVPVLPELDLDLRLSGSYPNLTVIAPGQVPEAAMRISGTLHHIRLSNVPLYCILLLSTDK
jgi:hypothetical protein